jgi:sarcosine oxidase gamma subunit
MKKQILLVLLLVPVLSLSACKRQALVNWQSQPFNAPANATLKQVTQAIEKACADQNWRIKKRGPGQMTVELDIKGKHSATVNITYDTKQFSIVYWSSRNLNYRVSGSAEQVHPQYNIKVKLLKQRIQDYAATI